MTAPDLALTVAQALRAATQALDGLPDGNPRREAELLLMEATGWPHTRLIAWPEQALDAAPRAAFERLVARRRSGEPLAYIRGRQAFWTLDLRVTPATLIPRPETELLVEIALTHPGADSCRQVADLGTGSGAIAAALARERPHWYVIALDRSAAALAVARANFAELGLSNCLAARGDWLSSLGSRRLDLILANPPYVPESDPHLTRGDLRFEPRGALASGRDGLDAIRAIVGRAALCLKPGGLLAVEHGFDQGPAVRRLFAQAGLRDGETRRDLAGQERVTLARMD
ncbi:MAG: peptide chain release factor N(5)-glutamine methyltransferase [Bdellovibrio bacteriovorus]